MNAQVKAILEDVADAHNTTVRDILDKSRFQIHVRPRWEVYYRLSHDRGYTAMRIGHIFDREHNSVAYGIVRHANLNGLPCRFRQRRAEAMAGK